MSSPPHQINYQWNLRLQLNDGSSLAEPNVFFTTRDHRQAIPSLPHFIPSTQYDRPPPTRPEDLYKGFQYCPQHTKQYEDLVRDNPELAVSLADILPNADADAEAEAEWQDAEQPGGTLPIAPGITPYRRSDQILPNRHHEARMDSADSRSTVARSSSSASASASASISSSSAPRKHYQYQHYCLGCGAAFDRASRARDHRYKDLRQTPYACGGRCGKGGCTRAYWSEALLDEHLLPIRERKAPCTQCFKDFSRKNMARHKSTCPKRNVAAKESDGE